MKINTTLSAVGILLLGVGCSNNDDDPFKKVVPYFEESKPALYMASSDELPQAYLKNYLISNYVEKPEQSYPLTEASEDLNPTISQTNTIETGVDEADVVKAFTLGGQQIVAAIVPPLNFGRVWLSEIGFTVPTPEVLRYVSLGSDESSNKSDSINLGDYSSGNEILQVNNKLLISAFHTSVFIDEDTYTISPLQARVKAFAIDDAGKLDESWQLLFDGRLKEKRKVGNSVYYLMESTPEIEGLVYPSDDSAIESNKKIINELDFDSLLPK